MLCPTRRSSRMAQRQLVLRSSSPAHATSALPSTLLSAPEQAPLPGRPYGGAAAGAAARSLAPGPAAVQVTCECAFPDAQPASPAQPVRQQLQPMHERPWCYNTLASTL